MTVRLGHLTVEHAEDPVGVDVRPRFGWMVDGGSAGARLLAWRVEVFAPDGARLWGRDDASGAPGVDIEYDGVPLRSLTRYRWQVAVTTDEGAAQASSSFTTGILDGDWRGAQWISHPTPGGAAPLLRHEFTVPQLAGPLGTAPVYLVVGAGGYARPEINGVPVPGFDLAPGFTDYDVTAQYCAVEITDLLVPGRNAIGVELGRGFYGMASPSTWNWETAPWHDEPCVRILIVMGDEVVELSDEGWRAVDGPTRYDDLYGGEDFDARHDRPGFSRAGYDDTEWASAALARGPRGRAVNQRQQPIAVEQTFAPERIEQTAPGRWLFTFPRVIAGRVRLQLDGAAGEVVTVRTAERLRADGRPDNDDPLGYYAGRFQESRITLAGAPLHWIQRFGYQGFRYVEVEAADEPVVEAELLHSAVARTGRFRCSSPLLNRVHKLTVDTVLNNLHGLPTDTPKYEKNGWTGDGMLGAELMLLNLDTHELLAKWADDIASSRHGTGAPEVIAPHGGWTMDWTPAPTWHAALLFVPWEIYWHRGDERVLADTWADASAYLEFELARWPDGIADTTLGDWVSPDADPAGGNAPEDTRIAATAFLIAGLDVAAKTAAVLGHDPEVWTAHATRLRQRFVEEFFDVGRAQVVGAGDRGDRQTHQVLALAFDLLPEPHRRPVADTLARLIQENGDHLDTGALGTKYLLPQLTRYGHADTALAVALQTDYPSWGLWIESGATSLWEHWSPAARSHGHYFLGTIDDWLFGSVAGISPRAAGWRDIRIEPSVLGLGSAEAEVLTPLGRAGVAWRREGTTVVVDVEIPVGAVATVVIGGREWVVASGRHRLVGSVPTDQSRVDSGR
ncbi:family 78 glycoside hydrolase catalytic domain [Herbiconiux sp. UC225_62]|uniref:family 78 glycoside hydrolase catalytic domain n=1 Tax=Herbiconiux sp. UC225_62 TaxID=3350168 RepID=UPI0036D3C690